MRVEDQLLARARIIAEKGWQERFNVGPIPEGVWKALTQYEYIQNLCFRVVQGHNEPVKENALLELVTLVAGALCYHYERPTKMRTREAHLKPSAQTRYKSILHHVVFEAVDQFARKVGFIELENGKTVIQDFDIALHAKTIFASDIDWERVRKSWNRRSVGKPIPSVEAFQKTCRRALAALARLGKPIPCERWLRHVIYPTLDQSKKERDMEERQRAAYRVVSLVCGVKALWKVDRLSAEQWARIAHIYNDQNGTDFTPDSFRRKFQRAKRVCKGYDSSSALIRAMERYVRLRSRTHEEYMDNTDRFEESFRKAVSDVDWSALSSLLPEPENR